MAALLLAAPAPAAAAEVFAGIAAHDVAIVGACCYEHGTDVQFGIRSKPFARLLTAELRGQAFGSVSTSGGIDLAAAGIQLRFNLPLTGLYVAPGIGAAIHDGPGQRFQATPNRLYLGSRLLFEPELVVGYHLAGPFAVEASYTHVSHAQLGGRQNPGLDTLGAAGGHQVLTASAGRRGKAAPFDGFGAKAARPAGQPRASRGVARKTRKDACRPTPAALRRTPARRSSRRA